MKNWQGSGGLSPSSSNLSAFAMPFTAPRGFLYPNSMPRNAPCEESGGVPSSDEVTSCDGPGFLPNLYSVPSYKVDPTLPTYTNYSGFSFAKTSCEMNFQPFSLDLPVGVSSTDDVATHLGVSGGDSGADPRGFFYPNSLPRVDPGEGSGVVPLSGEGNSWDGPGFMPNLYSVSKYKVDPILPAHANYSGFPGPGTSREMNGQPFSWDLPVGVSSTDHVNSRLGVLSRDNGANPSHPSYSLLGGSTNDSPSRPDIGKSVNSFSDHHTRVFSSISDTCDDRLEENAVKYPLKGARINGSYQLEEGHLASQHAAGTCNSKDPWNDGFCGPAVEYPPRSVQVVGEALNPLLSESWRRAPPPELASDIWKQQTLLTLWEQSTSCKMSNPDYQNLVTKSASLPAAVLQATASSIPIGQVTLSNGNSGIGGNDEIMADLKPFHEAKSYPLLDAGFEFQFDATYPSIQPDTYAFENMYVADGEGLPEEKFSSKNSFDHMLYSCSRHGFPSLHLENTSGEAGSHLACDLSTSNAWSFHHSDRGTDSLFSDKGPLTNKSLDQPWWEVFYPPDIPMKSDSRAPSHKSPTGNHDQEIIGKDPGSFFKLPAISFTSDGEQKFDGTVEVGCSWSKEIHSTHGTGGTTATEPVPNEGEKTDCEIYPHGNLVATSDMGSGYLADVVGKASSVTVKEISNSSKSVLAPENLSEKEKRRSIPKVDLHAMVLTMHNLSELLYYYSLTSECEVTEEDSHLLEKVIHNLASSSSKDVVLMSNSKKVLKNSKEGLTPCSEVTTLPRMLEDQLDSDNELVKSMFSSEEKCSGMLSSGVDLHVAEDKNSTQILNYGKQQSTDEGKCSSTMLSSEVHSCTGKDGNMIQAIKDILGQHYHEGPESDPQVHFFRNLWLEAEAELCFQNCKTRFNYVKSKFDTHGMKGSLEQNKNMTDSPRSCNDAKVSGESDFMARFDILKGQSHDLVGPPPPSIMAQDTEVDNLAEKASTSPHVSHSSILIGTRCHEENIDDAVMSRFSILLQRDESLRSKEENSVRVETEDDISEEKMCTTATGFPEHNNSEAVASTSPEHMENPVSDISVMSRWNILKQRNEIADSFENVGYQEMFEVERREELVDGHGDREVGCLYSDIMPYPNTVSSSSCGEQRTESVLERLKVLKLRDGHRSSAENNLMLRESVDLGAAVRGDYLSALKERAVEGSIAKARYALQKETASLADDAAKLDNGLGRGDNSAAGSFLKGKTSGDWFDIASSDWEHVLKEEVTGRTTKS